MNKKIRILSFICLIAMLFSSFSSVATYAEFTKETPVDPDMWTKPSFDTDHAYSFAFVGDTQYITCGDFYLGTEKLQYQYKYIADTAKERKLEHVFVLGDITDLGYKNDGNLAGSFYSTPRVGEWLIAKKAIFQLNGTGVTYSLCRGNHDDYMMDYFFNVPEYTDQFKEVGGFYSDSEAKWTDKPGVTKSRESDNPEAYVYWNALTGYNKDSIVNSWMTKEICGTKYLFMTVDFNPTENVLNWVNETLAAYPDHKAIITTHAYLSGSGGLIPDETGSTMYHFGITGQVLWERALSKHKNVFMVVSGHIGVTDLVYSYQTGDHGNKVFQVLVDPQSYDAKEINKSGDIEHGTQDTGLVLYMNFSEDGKKITFDYYSTLLGKFLKNNEYTFYLDGEDHNWDDGAVVTYPTKNEEGSKLYTCTDCGATKTLTLSKLGIIDARDLEKYGQQHHYLGDAVTGTKPNVTDGKVSAGEYSYSFEFSPSDPKNIVTISGNQAGGYTDTEKIKTYMSHDGRYLYLAFEVKDKVYCPDKDYFLINMGFRNGGSTVDAVSRLRYAFRGDASKKVLVENEISSTVGRFYKNNDGSWANAEGVVLNEHVPERSLHWNAQTNTLTLETKFDTKAMLDYWDNELPLEEASLYFVPIIQMYGDKHEGAGDAATDQGLLWYYFDNGNSSKLKSEFRKSYPQTTYWLDWFPHIIHFSHNWDDGEIKSESTHLIEGIKTYKCQDCDSTKNERLVKVAHEYSGEWSEFDDSYHSRACECGELEKEPHVYEGDVNKTCTVCGHIFVEKTEAVTTTVQSEVPVQNTDKKGCKGTFALSSLTLVSTLGVAAVFGKKKRSL